jgi:hypothetical protein
MNIIEKIDWEELQLQKQTLLEVSEMGCFTEKDYDNFNGLINLIDSLQDYAVDVLKMDQNVVFNLEYDEAD